MCYLKFDNPANVKNIYSLGGFAEDNSEGIDGLWCCKLTVDAGNGYPTITNSEKSTMVSSVQLHQYVITTTSNLTATPDVELIVSAFLDSKFVEDKFYGDDDSNISYRCNDVTTKGNIITFGDVNWVTNRGNKKRGDYGGTVTEDTAESVIYDLSLAFEEASLNYISAVHDQAATDSGVSIEALAEMYREQDSNRNSKEKWLTYVSLPDDNAIEVAYMAYADFMKKHIIGKAIEINKIDLDNPLTTISLTLVNSVCSQFISVDEAYKYNGYDITLKVSGWGKAASGEMTLKKGGKPYNVIVCTKTSETKEAMQAFIDNLEEITNDALHQALRSVVNELADITGFYDYQKESIEEGIKKYTKKIREAGYGNVLKVVKKCYDGYDIIKDIIAFDDAVHITDALSKSKTLHKKLSRLEYTDAAVDNLIVKQALEKLENARKKLADKLEAYGKPAGEEQTEKLGFFDKVDSWISSLIQCPVDFTVYDESGNEVGYVRN